MGRTLQIICGCVLAAGLCASASALEPQKDAPQQQQQAAQPEAGPALNVTPPSPPSPNPLEAACEKGDEKRYSDLCAQWRAADSARESAFWTAATFWTAFIGLVIGAVTVAAAVFAALFARDAARHTQKGAAVARAALRDSRKASRDEAVRYENQLAMAKASSDLAVASQRPWVKASIEVSEVQMDMAEGSSALIESKVVLENVGKSPAILDRWSETRAVLCRTPLLGSGRRIAEIEESARKRQPASVLKGRVPIFPEDTIRHYGSSVASFRPDEARPVMPPEISHFRLPDDGPDYAIYMAVDLTYSYVSGVGNTRVYYEIRGKDAPLTRRKAPYTADELRIERLDFYSYAD